ncbi:MAG: heavy metal translocating P-type ATPase [Armatimonadota bacterium]|nr:heavy metal translocating P-type ATPase [Armatimonadota bacterium]MDR7471387.1 heavy metal translocating P-type ATPase [Armatimonadota bacterium]MDR7508157.1 heavy metal translocating P-type ATPase [Armatimonadota bacterium]MDR7509525.1 heavy metal translocating P-type ATPase [Armatimonadota bacterium]MDR7516580.1 heavy metal translocating P-type ATPase [Armatimonadota bacterium]
MDRDEVYAFEGPWWRYPPMRDALASGGIIAAAWAVGHLGGWRAVEVLLFALAGVVGGRHFVREGISALWRERVVGIDILMAAAALGAAALGLWDEAALLVFLYAGAEALEEFAYARTRSAIRSLLALAPQQARVLRDGQEVVVPAADLRPGDRFVVRPGEAIPTDGVVREGVSAVDEAPVTGESLPVDKGPGDPVYAGTVNRHGALVVEATAAFADNTLSRIIHLVEEAQERKGRLQSLIERFGRRYSPAVLAAAAALAVVPPAFGQPWLPWALRAVVLLVAAAPCALVMSTPVAVAAGIAIAGRHGVLVKGGAHLEQLGRVQVVAFDKTGTLTEGTPDVTDVLPLGDATPGDVLALAASVERLSEHVIGAAVVRRAEADRVPLRAASEFRALPGLGAQARVDGMLVSVGTLALAAQSGATVDPALAEGLLRDGKTVIAVVRDSTPVGLIAVRDRLRAEAREAVDRLRRLGVRTVMLTGDSEQTAAAIARELGIDHVHARLRPEDKVRIVERMRARGVVVAMVGDGINDAPALAAASVGIAMGVAGTDAAIEAADVALMADDLRQVAYAIRVGRTVRWISAQNVVFSLLILSVLIPGALVGALTVVSAVLIHEISELLAVANGLRVARCRPA